MTELELIIDLHKDGDRQGPGSESDTLQALQFIDLSSEKSLKVADIGCGSGGQTITLAQHLDGEIVAVDLFPQFLMDLEAKSKALGLQHKITTMQKSMDDLPFSREEFDVIWSEGAIYNIGFEAGIKSWKEFLKIGGYLAISEITWITNSRPKELEDFWKQEYPEIDTASHKISLLENHGYSLVGYFYLNQKSWIKHYFEPLEARFDAFLERNHSTFLAQKVVDAQKSEIAQYRKYKDYFSYGFYVVRRDS